MLNPKEIPPTTFAHTAEETATPAFDCTTTDEAVDHKTT